MSKTVKKLSVVILSVLLAISMIMVLAVSFGVKADTAPLAKSHLVTKGAAIRLDKEPNGIRFPLLMKSSDYATYQSEIVESGMIFAPEALYDATEFDVDVAGTAGTNARKVVNTNGWTAWSDEDGTAYMRIMVTITGIPESQLAQRICFVGYVKTATDVIYTDVVSRSIAEVALMYIQDKGTEADAVAYDFIPGGEIEALDEQEFEVYSSIDTTTKALTANNLTVDLSDKEVSAVKFAKLVNDKKELVVDATVSDGVVSIAGTEVGASIYGDYDLVLFTDTCTVVAPLNIITKKINTLDDLRYMGYYGGIANGTNQYDGYYILTQDIGFESKSVYTRQFNVTNNSLQYSIWEYMKDGFVGVFDGQGHMLTHVWFYQPWNDNGVVDTYKSKGGIFGCVASEGVVKNFGVTAYLNGSTTRYYQAAVLAEKFNGTLENCYIEILSTSGADLAAIAQDMSGIRMKDVVLKTDASGVNYIGYMSGTAVRVLDSKIVDGSKASFTNVHAIVKDPASGAINADYGFHEYAEEAGVFNGLTKYAYDAEVEFTPSDATYWNLNGKQPLWAAIPVNVEVQGADFEVYNSISETTPVANTLSIDLADVGLANPQSVILSTEKASETLTTADYAVADGTLTISGEKFGASIYGDVSVKIVEGKNSLTYKTNVITKKIYDLNDMFNLAYYGGLADNKYSGYFVLANDIAPATTQRYKNKYSIKNNSYGGYESAIWAYVNDGFNGVFDGQGHVIKNIRMYDWYNDNYREGLFGCVSGSGVVKNLAVIAQIDTYDETYNQWNSPNYYGSLLGNKFNGTLENCYFSVTPGSKGCEIAGFARNISRMVAKDVVLKFDGTTMGGNKSYLCISPANQVSSVTQQNSVPSFTNVHAFVKEAEGVTLNAWQDYFGSANDIYNNGGVLSSGLTKHGYEDELTTFAPTDTTYWDLTGSQPIFISAK